MTIGGRSKRQGENDWDTVRVRRDDEIKSVRQ